MNLDPIHAYPSSNPAARSRHTVSRRLRRLGAAALLLLWTVGPALARGDKIIPQVADGAGRIRTKINISNLSPSAVVTRMKIYFFQPDSSPWIVATNLGTASEFLLDLGRSQTLRIETLGLSPGLNSGYAIIRDGEGNSTSALDYRIGVSVFYEVLDGARVVDTVSVPAGEPTRRWMFPVEIDAAKGLYSGFAIVNLSDATNRVTFKLWTAFPPASADASDGGTVDLVLAPGEQRARFLSQPELFPQYAVYNGILSGTAEKPVAVLGLLQTQAATGVQYATLAAEHIDSIQKESYCYLPQTSLLDADAIRVPFSTTDDGNAADILFQVISSTVRYIVPQNGSTLAPLGIRTASEVATLTLEDLRGAAYAAAPLDVTDISGNLVPGFSFAVRTSQGRLGKIRVARVVSLGEVKDVVLQVTVYR